MAGGGVISCGACRGCGITMRRAGGACTATGAGATEGVRVGDGATLAAVGSAGIGAVAATTGVDIAEGGVIGCPAGRVGCALAGAGRFALGCTKFGAGRGTATDAGVTERGAGAVAAGELVTVGAFAAGRADAGATVIVGRAPAGPMLGTGRGGGAERAAASACLRSRIALSASPGLETWDRLKPWPWRFSPEPCREAPPPVCLGPRVRWPRTFSASSSSMELECVFFSVTPTAVRASRMERLFTSSSLARSLMRTLLIRSFV